MTAQTDAPRIAEIVVSGTPDALGEAHGETLRSLIGEVYAWRMGEIRQATGESEVAVLDRAVRYLAAAEALLPHIVTEVHGIGRGSGLGFRRAFFLQVATEVSLDPVAGCSAIGVLDVEGGPIVAQNWDQPIASAGKQVVVRFRPSDRPEILMFGHAGVVGYIGLNDRGVGHVGNQLYSSEAPRADGLTQYFINRRLLEFGGLEPALAWLTSVPIASTCNYLIGDAAGGLADVELGAGRATVQGRGRSLTHTNHYLVDHLAGSDTHATVLPDSPARLAALRAGRLGVASLQGHVGHPRGVCRHEEPPGISTRASIELRLADRELAVAPGPPCVTPYTTYRMAPA